MREEKSKSFELRNAEGKRQCYLQADMEADERHRVHEYMKRSGLVKKKLMNIKS